MNRSKQFGFTLIELLVVISIIAILVGVVFANFGDARLRARDVKLKQEMENLKIALRLYYNDYNTYPNDVGGLLNNFNGCGDTGTTACPCVVGSTSYGFAAGASCSTLYMKNIPPMGLGSGLMRYDKTASGDFCLFTSLENKGDSGIAESWARCAGVCGSYCDSGTEYCVCSE